MGSVTLSLINTIKLLREQNTHLEPGEDGDQSGKLLQDSELRTYTPKPIEKMTV